VKKTLSVCFISTFLLLAPGIASAQCSNATLTGPWGFNIQGTSPSTISGSYGMVPSDRRSPKGVSPDGIPQFETTINSFAIAGIITFDGKGNFTATFVYDGKDTVSGTYTVNSNCSFTLYGLPFFPLDGIFVNGFTQFQLIIGRAGYTGVGSGVKISATCTNASPAGNWGYSIQGMYGPSDLNFFTIGTLAFDGAGHVVGPITLLSTGVLGNEGFITGTYSVNSDCTFTMQLSSLPISYFGVFTNAVTQFYVVAENGNAVSGFGQRQ
jgi:hypothetical protein